MNANQRECLNPGARTSVRLTFACREALKPANAPVGCNARGAGRSTRDCRLASGVLIGLTGKSSGFTGQPARGELISRMWVAEQKLANSGGIPPPRTRRQNSMPDEDLPFPVLSLPMTRSLREPRNEIGARHEKCLKFAQTGLCASQETAAIAEKEVLIGLDRFAASFLASLAITEGHNHA